MSPTSAGLVRSTGSLLLFCLLILSFWLFCRPFSRILSKIRSAHPDSDLNFKITAHRVWVLAWEVMCQAKVIRERPGPGIFHAFVFWGFCAFALVTLNHIAQGFGLPFLDKHSPFGALYFWFAFAFAICCAVSISALAFRRFVLRPKWLEPVSYESGFIAFLIFILMITYLPEWWISDSSSTGHTLWWAHTLALLLFLPLVPHTKHLHLILSPFTLFLKRPGFSQIPPLHGDEDFGLISGKDITQLSALQAYSCVECGRCTQHCPANNTGKELNPKLIALGFRDYLNDEGPHSETPILEAKISQTAIFQCTTCGACEYQCPVGIQHLPMIIGLRRGAVNTGGWEDGHGTKLFLNLERNGNAMGFSRSERDKFIAKQQWPAFDGSQQYCLWLGCMGAFDPNGREIVSAFASIMQYLGTTFGILTKERCTGDPARRLGNDLIFSQLAEANGAALQQAGVTKIVSICPHCVRTMAQDWRDLGIVVEIEHHTEFLARHSARLPKNASEKSTVYHDPCYLGRYRDVYDQPRQIIALTSNLINPPRSHERSFCCGAGGGLVFLGEETGSRVSHTRAAELQATGANVIAAACPFCSSMFRDALSGTENAPELKDVAQIVAQSIKGESIYG